MREKRERERDGLRCDRGLTRRGTAAVASPTCLGERKRGVDGVAAEKAWIDRRDGPFRRVAPRLHTRGALDPAPGTGIRLDPLDEAAPYTNNRAKRKTNKGSDVY
nr:hypothetical protein [Pandoravirus belohorizontensis]